MSLRILTIDDSRMPRVMVAKVFQPLGCDVYEAPNATDGISVAMAINPDLIFLDVTMPDMNGLVALEKMRQIPALQATPIIMLTAESGNVSVERADKQNVAGYIAKPFKSEQLLAIAGPILNLKPLPSP